MAGFRFDTQTLCVFYCFLILMCMLLLCSDSNATQRIFYARIICVTVPCHINQFHIGVAIVERIVIHDAGIVGTTWPEHAVTNSSLPIHENLSKKISQHSVSRHDNDLPQNLNCLQYPFAILSRKHTFQSPFNVNCHIELLHSHSSQRSTV